MTPSVSSQSLSIAVPSCREIIPLASFIGISSLLFVHHEYGISLECLYNSLLEIYIVVSISDRLLCAFLCVFRLNTLLCQIHLTC